MARSRAEATAVATSQELLRSALHRSQRRNTWVARRRLVWRWAVYLLGRGLLYLGPPLLLAATGAWLWRQTATPSMPGTRAPQPPAAAASVPAMPAAAPPAASAPLQLRLDEDAVQSSSQVRHPRLPLRASEAASAADAQESM